MNDVYTVFEGRLKFLIDVLDEHNYVNCFRSMLDLTVFCTMAEYEDGVLISEVLENVFYDMAYLYDTRQVEDKDKIEITRLLKKQIAEILKTYRTDTNKAYASLKKMRFESTKHQLHWENMANKKTDQTIDE
jgi:hypothetical protein